MAAIKMLAEKTRPALAKPGSLNGRAVNGVGGSPYLARCGRLVTPSPDTQRRLQVGNSTPRSQRRPPPVYARRGEYNEGELEAGWERGGQDFVMEGSYVW